MSAINSGAKAPIGLVVIHRYPMLRLGIRSSAEAAKSFRVVAETDDPDSGFDLIDASTPEVAVLDMQLPSHSGFDVLRDLRKRWPRMRVLIYCDVPMSDYPERCLRAGAHGYVGMNEPVANFVEAVARVGRGQIYLSEYHSTALLSRLTHDDRAARLSPVERLSEGELGVLTFIAKGMSNRQIAEALHRSIKTVETYRSRIKRKVGVPNATALAQFAVRHFDRSRSASGRGEPQ